MLVAVVASGAGEVIGRCVYVFAVGFVDFDRMPKFDWVFCLCLAVKGKERGKGKGSECFV